MPVLSLKRILGLFNQLHHLVVGIQQRALIQERRQPSQPELHILCLFLRALPLLLIVARLPLVRRRRRPLCAPDNDLALLGSFRKDNEVVQVWVRQALAHARNVPLQLVLGARLGAQALGEHGLVHGAVEEGGDFEGGHGGDVFVARGAEAEGVHDGVEAGLGLGFERQHRRGEKMREAKYVQV